MTMEEYIAAYKQGVSVGIRGMCVYEDKLIVSCINSEGAVICESEAPSDQDSFKIIATDQDLFGYPAYNLVIAGIAFTVYRKKKGQG